MKIKDVAFTAYAVSDVERARAFYRDVLGLKEGQYFNDRFFEFDVGSSTFAIDGDPPPGLQPGSSSGVNFEVDDVVAAREHLIENDATVTEVYEFQTCSICFAMDPDGNGFALHQRKDVH